MKTLLSIIFLLAVSLTSFAQFSAGVALRQTTNVASVDSDTAIDTGTARLLRKIANPNSTYAIVADFLKYSGTLGGTAKLQGSVDGTNWFDVGSAYTVTNTAGTQYNSWVVAGTAFPYNYVSILWTGTGTMAGRLRTKIYGTNIK